MMDAQIEALVIRLRACALKWLALRATHEHAGPKDCPLHGPLHQQLGATAC